MGVRVRGRFHLDDGGVVEWLFTDRTAGVSSPPFDGANLGLHVEDDPVDVAANRAALAAQLAISVDALATMNQVHGRDVAEVVAPWDVRLPPRADALITDSTDVALVTQVADCVPILLASPGGMIAAVHSGWRGVVAGVVDATMEAFIDRGVPVETLRAWIGPAICAGCYEVGAQVRDEVAQAASAAWAQTRWGSPAVDVRAAVGQQLARYGVGADVVDDCTFHDEGLFSYRRDGRTGRQAGVIMRRGAQP
jgi:YfiH family protein